MNSDKLGESISGAEVTQVSPHGIWILVGGRELYASFTEFPWFRDATIGQISRVELPRANHLYWPELDIDLTVESLVSPADYPLVSRVRPVAGVAEAREPIASPLPDELDRGAGSSSNG